ncbi:MAG: FMN-binding protein, partial [Oscillospiraceae bacterium]|nr:FMN-binding protein [Oscillospiraceae bacterium]
MNKKALWELLRPIVVLVVISCVCTAALSTTSVITAPVIAEQMAAAERAAKLEVLPEGADFAPVSEEEMATLPEAIVKAEKAGNGAGFVFTTETKGFGGMARAMFGVNSDGAIVLSKVLDHGETEGIGSKVMKNGS